jgi:hypothetical protein
LGDFKGFECDNGRDQSDSSDAAATVTIPTAESTRLGVVQARREQQVADNFIRDLRIKTPSGEQTVQNSPAATSKRSPRQMAVHRQQTPPRRRADARH